jgi:hypothetical protein
MSFRTFVLAALISSALLVHASPANVTELSASAQVITKCTVPHTAALTFDDGPYDYIRVCFVPAVLFLIRLIYFIFGI